MGFKTGRSLSFDIFLNVPLISLDGLKKNSVISKKNKNDFHRYEVFFGK